MYYSWGMEAMTKYSIRTLRNSVNNWTQQETLE